MSGQYFISYSRIDGEEIAVQLADQLTAGPPSISVWLDQRRLQAGIDWDEQLIEALRACEGLLYVMTKDSVSPNSECKKEWIRALKYKKPIIPLLVHRDAELPFGLEPRQYINFCESFDAGLAKLRKHLRWRDTPEGALHTLKERLHDARRDLARVEISERPRIQEEIAELERQIAEQQQAIDNPHAVQEETKESIHARLERERQPAEPVSGEVRTHLINRLPMIPPVYFQDRHVETGLIGTFLQDEGLRLMTVIGRGGVGKTAMVCRLLRSLQVGMLPDDGGALVVDGIVYLSARAGNFPNLFADLCKLLPETTAKRLNQLYRDAKQSTAAQMQALLAEFPSGRTIVFLDNFENVVDAETQTIKEQELDDSLRTALEAPPHGVKFLLTTRVAPQALLLTEPALQRTLELERGLPSPYAEEVLKAMDADGTLGLHDPEAPLDAAREATLGYPRALEAIVAILRADRSTTLPEILVELQQLQPQAGNVVKVLVGEAFNRLDPMAQKMMQALAVYGAPVPSVAVDYLLQPYTIGIHSAPVLGRLVNMHFVRRDAGRYFLHQIDRNYALGCIPRGELADRTTEHPPFTRYALFSRAADYCKETRKPRESWKRLDDLATCRAEFELRCAADDHDAAAQVLLETKDCLETWGHYKLLVDLHQRVRGRLTNAKLELSVVLGLAWSYCRVGSQQSALPLFQDALALARSTQNRVDEVSAELGLGDCRRSEGDYSATIAHYENALAIARGIEDRGQTAAALGSLATIMSELGQTTKAIEYGREASTIAREIGDRRSECTHLFNLGCAYNNNGKVEEARHYYSQARKIADDLGFELMRAHSRIGLGDLLNFEERWSEAIPFFQEAVSLADDMHLAQAQIETRLCLVQALLGVDDLPRAEAAVKKAGRYTFRLGSPNLFALKGVIALRQSDVGGGDEAFREAIAQADELLQHAHSNWNALYAKALALAGLALCRDADLVTAAAETYRQAHAINSNLGLRRSALHDLNSLAKADPKGFLRPVRTVWPIKHAENNQVPPPSQPSSTSSRIKVFISYSHADKKWLERLKRHLKPLVREGYLDCWDDSHIRPGDDWQQEIRTALNTAQAAVLLISADFFASDLIDETELPPLLTAAQAEGVRVLPVILSASRFVRDPNLAQFQAINSPDRPLNKMPKGEQEEVLECLARTIESALKTETGIGADARNAR